MGRVSTIFACALAALGASAALLAGTARAQSTIAWAGCSHSNEFACAQLPVALDPSGAVPGTISLSLMRHRAPVGEARSAVIAIAGGPGQAANPFAEFFAQVLGPIINTRDLIVFDQRGTGTSGPLRCPHAERATTESMRQVIRGCAHHIGAARAFYTTADSVADIEAILQAGGYEKAILYGTSYGTKVAEQFAQDHPEQVEGLVLDSVVTPNGPDERLRSTLRAVPRVLRQLCARHACAGVTRHPVRDLRRLVERMHRRGLRGRVIASHGRRHTIGITSGELLDVLVAGDLEPVLRAEFPAAIHSALHHDDAALARLIYRGLYGSGEGSSGGIDTALYYATTCEESRFPWQRGSSPKQRLREARRSLRAIPHRILGAFTPQDVLEAGDMQACSYWPFASSGPLVDDNPLPQVPTLILSGAQDLRTPTSDARRVAAAIPGSHLLVVPDTGHSVLGTDRSGCAEAALQALFAGRPAKACEPEPLPPALRPVPVAPDRLSEVSPARGQRGRLGRTAHAVSLTLSELAREISLRMSTGPKGALGHSLSTAGLRSGWAAEGPRGIEFHRYSYVPGLVLSGVLAPGGLLRVSGRTAAHGTLRLGKDGHLTGVLAGRRVSIAAGSQAELAARGL